MVNPGLAFMERHNDLHPSYSTLSFARISRLYRQINNLRQISCIISDFENESVLRTKRAKRWRNVLPYAQYAPFVHSLFQRDDVS
jgi:hypothetical protein